jgi:predicted metalloendopeptidase
MCRVLFEQLSHTQVEELVKEAVDDSKDPAKTPSYEKTLIADLFTSGIDEKAIQASSKSVIKPYITEIEGIKSVEDAFRVAFQQKSSGLSVTAFMGMIAGEPDFENSSILSAKIKSGGFSLPKSFYTEEKLNPTLNAYHEFTMKVLKLGLGGVSDKQAGALAQKVIDFEMELAAVALNSEDEARNVSMGNNRYMYSDLHKEFPGIPWNVISQVIHLSPQEIGKVTVDCPRYALISNI